MREKSKKKKCYERKTNQIICRNLVANLKSIPPSSRPNSSSDVADVDIRAESNISDITMADFDDVDLRATVEMEEVREEETIKENLRKGSKNRNIDMV